LANDPTCGSKDDFTGNKDCVGAIAESLGGLVGLVTKGFAGGWEDDDGKEFLGSVIDLTQGVIEATNVLPVTLVSAIMFPMLKSFLGVAMDSPTEGTLSGYVTLKLIFERKLRGNAFRMDVLEEELDWFDGLFLKDKTLINSSVVYNSAGLSHLLNMQHDFALDQPLFFGAECLLTGDKDNFRKISAGRCSAQLGDSDIMHWQFCEQAAKALDLGSTTVTNVTSAEGRDKPRGCYLRTIGGQEVLFFNDRPDNKGEGLNATQYRQVLCSNSAVDENIAAECRLWQQSGTWELAAMYAIANLGVLVDIARQFPALRETTLNRVRKFTGQYTKLLTASFSEYKRHRMTYLTPPKLLDNWGIGLWCAAWIGWEGKYVTEGRDYFYQTGSDEKCRGQCDVMSDYCQVRDEDGPGKYCVEDPSKYGIAEVCFERYTDNLKAKLDTTFGHVIGNLTELHDTVAALR